MTETSTTKPKLEKAMMTQLESWVKSQGEKQPKRSKSWSWISGLLIAAIAMLAMGFAYFRAWKQGRELAKLKHEKDVAKQELERKKVSDLVTEREKAQAAKWVTIREAEDKVTAIDVALKVLDEKKVRTHETIKALRDWDDVDRYLNSQR